MIIMKMDEDGNRVLGIMLTIVIELLGIILTIGSESPASSIAALFMGLYRRP